MLKITPTPPLCLQLPNGRSYLVPAPSRGRVEECELWRAFDISTLSPAEQGVIRSEMLVILTRGSVRLLDDGTTNPEEPLPVKALDVVGEIEVLHALVALHYRMSPSIAVDIQRKLISREISKLISVLAATPPPSDPEAVTESIEVKAN